MEKILKSTQNLFRSNRKKNFKKADKNDNEDTITITYKIKIIDSARFMVHDQILLIILGKKFLKWNIKIVIVFWIWNFQWQFNKL